MALKKIDMISKLTEVMDLDQKKATDSVEKLIEIMKSTLASGEEILISGFGKFSVNEKHERRGRNPATGEDKILPARKVVSFKSSGSLRKRVNGKNGN